MISGMLNHVNIIYKYIFHVNNNNIEFSAEKFSKHFKTLFLTPINYQPFQNIIFNFDQPLPHKPILAQQIALKYTCFNLQI